MCLSADGCVVAAPTEGGESCHYSELGRGETDYDVHRLAGTWFLLAQSTRVPDVVVDDAVTYVTVDNQTVNFTFSFYKQ